jgi:hypothetical protein
MGEFLLGTRSWASCLLRLRKNCSPCYPCANNRSRSLRVSMNNTIWNSSASMSSMRQRTNVSFEGILVTFPLLAKPVRCLQNNPMSKRLLYLLIAEIASPRKTCSGPCCQRVPAPRKIPHLYLNKVSLTTATWE